MVSIWEQWAKLLDQLLLAIVLVNHRLVLFDDREALVKDLLAVFAAHKLAELGELARGDVDHLFLAHVARHVAVLALVLQGRVLRALGLGLGKCRVDIISICQVIDIVLVSVVADVRDVPWQGGWRLNLSLLCVGFLASRRKMLFVLLQLVVEERRVVVLLHELLRWLVSGLFSLSSCLSRSSLLLLLFLLLPLELLEDVLVMQERVRELVHEDGAREEPVDAALDDRHLEQLVDRWSFRRVPLEHHGDDVGDGGGEVRWQRRVLALDDLLSELVE